MSVTIILQAPNTATITHTGAVSATITQSGAVSATIQQVVGQGVSVQNIVPNSVTINTGGASGGGTLDSVTSAGNTTANSIEVGSVTANGNFLINGLDSLVELRGTSVDFNIQTADAENIARIATTTGGSARFQLYNHTEGFEGAEEFKATTWEDDALVISGGIPTTTKLLVSRNPNEATLQVTGDASISGDIILTSPNDTAYRIVVGNDGTLAAIPPTSTAPSITTLPTISGTLEVGETLTATAGNVSGVPTPTRVLQWQRSDNGTTGWADISGATGTSYLLGSLDEDKYIRVAQTEENILGTATANSASTAQIQPAAFDPDAQAFITAASITDSTQQSAIDTLVIDLKTAGVWTKMKAIYPIVGGTASSHKFNLKDPRDLDAAFRLTFTSGWTHSADGAAVTAKTATYADTHLLPSSELSTTSAHMSYYAKTLVVNDAQIAIGDGNINSMWLGLYSSIYYGAIANNYRSQSYTSAPAYYLVNKSSSTELKFIIDSSIVSTKPITSTSFSGTQNLYLNNHNNSSVFTSVSTCAFATIGDGLTDTESSDLYTAIQAFQTTLGRQV